MSDLPTIADPLNAAPVTDARTLAPSPASGAAETIPPTSPPAPPATTGAASGDGPPSLPDPEAARSASTVAEPPAATNGPANDASADAAPSTRTPNDPGIAPGSTADAQAVQPEPVDPIAEANKVGFDLRFVDAAGRPIAGLQHKVILTEDGKRLEFPSTSDARGRGPSMSGMEISTPLEIWIRKDDGTYVMKHKGTVGCKDTSLCMVSPHIRIPVGTELHAGSAGTLPPKPAPGDPAVERRPNAPLTQSAGGRLPDATLRSGRDQKGNPVATATTPSMDANGKHRLPTLGLFTWGATGGGAAGAATTPQKTPSGQGGMRADAKKVADLVTTMEQQVTWDWNKVKETYGTSGGITTAMASKTFDYAQPTKNPGVFKGKCYLSVKVGLWRVGLVEGVGGGVHPATEAKPWLLSQGFVALTPADVPDARWALPGDVIVYQYDDATIAANNQKIASALAKYEEDKKAFPDRQKAFAVEHDAWKARQQVSLAQLKPGKKARKDPEPKPPAEPRQPEGDNYGHIDVRSFDAYLSDAKTLSLPNPTLHGGVKGMVVNGIYRKAFDPVAGFRTRAFLKCLREWECHSETDDAKRYFMLNSPIDGKFTFTDTSRHPYEGISSSASASGAYQILYSTYKLYHADRFGLPEGFTPILQDRIAVAMLEEMKDNGRQPTISALGEIRKGNIQAAVRMLNAQWTSLPGGSEARKEKGHVFTMDDFMARFDVFLKEYSNA